MALYRIAWKISETAMEGHGDYLFTYETAQDWLSHLEKEHPDMHHWIEQEDYAAVPAL